MKMSAYDFDFMFEPTEVNSIIGYAAVDDDPDKCLYFEGVYYGIVFDTKELVTFDVVEKAYFLATLEGIVEKVNESDIPRQDDQCQY